MVGRMKVKCDAPFVSFPVSVFKEYILKDPVRVMDKEDKDAAEGTVNRNNKVHSNMQDNSDLLNGRLMKLKDVKQPEDEMTTEVSNKEIANGMPGACENEVEVLSPRSTATSVLLLDSPDKALNSHLGSESPCVIGSNAECELQVDVLDSSDKKMITESSDSAPENFQAKTCSSDATFDVDVIYVYSDNELNNDVTLGVNSKTNLDNKNLNSFVDKSKDNKESVAAEKVLTHKASSDDLKLLKMLPVVESIDHPVDQASSSQTDLVSSKNSDTGESGLPKGHCDSVGKAHKVSSESSCPVAVTDTVVAADDNKNVEVATLKTKNSRSKKQVCASSNDENLCDKRKAEDEGPNELKKICMFAEKLEPGSEITLLKKQIDVLTKKVEDGGILKYFKDSTSTPTNDSSKSLNPKSRRLTRRELCNIIKEQLVEKIIYQNELGRKRRECEQLQNTLEKKNIKAGQFHKEVENMKKVTKKLQMEFLARRGQVSTIKIRRSVGIQSSPNIISHGLLNAGTMKAKVIEARPFNEAASGTSTVSMTGSASSAKDRFAPPRVLDPTSTSVHSNSLATFSPFSSAVRLPRSQIVSNVPVVLPQAGPVLGTFSSTVNRAVLPNKLTALQTVSSPTARLVRTPLVMVAPPGVILSSNTSASSNSYNALNANSGPLGNIASRNNAFPRLPVATKPVLPASNVATNKISVAVPSVTTALSNVNKGCLTIASNSSVITPIPSIPNANLHVIKHPAPLPQTPPQQMCGSSKMLPPQPDLRLSKKENSIILSWNMQQTANHEDIGSYQIYAYQEGPLLPDTKLWKKVGSVKALELPMACTLTQFVAGHTYHFAVRPVDVKTRLGQFSDPQSIKLD